MENSIDMDRILIVEDETIISMQFEEYLRSHGYAVVGEATSGRDAILKARSLRPDLILMDIFMPGDIDGIMASQTITAELDIPVIFITAHTDEKTLTRAKNICPYGYIIKPINENEVRATIEIALFKKKQESFLKESEKKYRKICEIVDDALIIADIESGKIIDLNVHAIQLFEIPSHELLGMDYLKLFPEDKRKNFLKLFRKIGNGANVTSQSIPIQGKNNNGIVVNLYLNITELWNRKVLLLLFRKAKNNDVCLPGGHKKNPLTIKKEDEYIIMCAWCKRINEKQSEWKNIELFINTIFGIQFSHTICPDCLRQHYPRLDNKNKIKS